MKRSKHFKNILSCILAIIIFLSPLFLTGCFDASNDTGGIDISGGGSGGGETGGGGIDIGGGGGSTGGGGSGGNASQDYRESLDRSEFPDYFKNYRVTFRTGNNERSEFDSQIVTQNSEVATSILTGLFAEYGSGSSMFGQQVDYVQANDKFVLYPCGEDEYATISITKNSAKIFEHSNAINDDVDKNFANASWNWNTKSVASNENAEASKNAFISAQNTKKLQLAILLIQNGFTLQEDGSGTFAEQYNSYLDGDGNLRAEVNFEELASTITHLGFTESDALQIEYFVMNYIIGTELLSADNARFVNAYFDGTDVKAYSDQNFDRFLTYECYLTAKSDTYRNGSTISFDLTNALAQQEVTANEIVNTINGAMYYTAEYFKSASQSNIFTLPEYDITIPTQVPNLMGDSYLGDYEQGFGVDNVEAVSPENSNDISRAIFENFVQNLVPTEYRSYAFNANVWAYNSKGTANAVDAQDTVKCKIDGVERTLFSIRFPYFKNYYNTVCQIVANIVEHAPYQSTVDAWEEKYGSPYPFDKEYPNVPACLFADYDNADMLFGDKGVETMFSGYQNYQNMVLMPQQMVQLNEGAIFVVRQLASEEVLLDSGATDGSGDFDLTVYARYYDAETQSYATWADASGAQSEFYKIGTQTVKYCEYPSDTGIKNLTPTVFNFSIKNILSASELDKENPYILDPFANDSDLSLHNIEVISKTNRGHYFSFVETPDGKQVVCYNGKSAGSPSYFELVFSCDAQNAFMFSFMPTIAYSVDTSA